ncbi:MAG: hypothetical protein IPO66_16265 [Rhodanobacteraceae bacterium]|nr:hypothetical protein [Rhodanobacteraceae bacterium]
MKAGSLEHHQQSAAVAALHSVDPDKVLADLLAGAEGLHGLAEQLSMTRNAALCDQIAAHAEGIRRAAHRARVAILAKPSVA